MIPSAPEYLFLTEATLPRLLWRAWRRRPTCIIGTWSFLTVSDGGWLRRLADRLRTAGRVEDLLLDRAGWVTHADSVALILADDTFATNEPALERIFAFAESDRRFGRYGLAYRHAISNQSIHHLLVMERVADISRMETDPAARLSGVDPEILALHTARHGAPPRLRTVPPLPLRGLFNLGSAAAVLIVAVIWCLSRIRRHPPMAEQLLLGSDFINDRRDFLLWDEVSDDQSAVMAVFRNDDYERKGRTMLGTRRGCGWSEGFFAPGPGFEAAAEAASDVVRLLVAGWSLPPDIFRTIIRLPWRRMTFRALFNRYRFRFFWDRSDYDTAHIVRSQELRAIGGKSLGLMHGIASIASVLHQLRHLDYDIYFALGRNAVTNYLGKTWLPSMEVRLTGSFGLSRDEYHRMAARAESRDMVFFVVPTVQGNAALDVAGAVAAAFPDRHIWIHTKGKHVDAAYTAIIEAVVSKHPNMGFYRERSYDLMLQCGYVVSEGSTLTAEAIQFGLCGFVLDLIGKRWKYNYFRNYNGIAATSAEELIGWIRELETGHRTYPRSQLRDMINMSGEIYYDTVRRAMGLEPKEPPIAELAFFPEDFERPPHA